MFQVMHQQNTFRSQDSNYSLFLVVHKYFYSKILWQRGCRAADRWFIDKKWVTPFQRCCHYNHMLTLKTELHNQGLCKQANRNKQERSSHVGVSEPLLLMCCIYWVFLSCPPFFCLSQCSWPESDRFCGRFLLVSREFFLVCVAGVGWGGGLDSD